MWKEENIEWISQSGAQEIQAADYEAVLLGDKSPKDLFVFRPPKGSTRKPVHETMNLDNSRNDYRSPAIRGNRGFLTAMQ